MSNNQERVYQLLQMSEIKISEFGIDRLEKLNIVNRTLPNFGMSYISEGTAKIVIRDHTFVTEPGMVCIFPPIEPHDHIKISSEPAQFYWWIFEMRIFGAIDTLKLIHLPITFRLLHTSEFEKCFTEYVKLKEAKECQPHITFYEKAKELEIVSLLLEGAVNSNMIIGNKNIPARFIDILFDLLCTNDRHSSLKELSKRYNMHPNYLSGRFKHYFDIPPMVLHHTSLMEVAKTMLTNSTFNVSEIADSLGFESLYSFSRFFTSHLGLSPSAYRKRKT